MVCGLSPAIVIKSSLKSINISDVMQRRNWYWLISQEIEDRLGQSTSSCIMLSLLSYDWYYVDGIDCHSSNHSDENKGYVGPKHCTVKNIYGTRIDSWLEILPDGMWGLSSANRWCLSWTLFVSQKIKRKIREEKQKSFFWLIQLPENVCYYTWPSEHFWYSCIL